MKTIGMLGGMSWESTERYYRLIRKGVKKSGQSKNTVVLRKVNLEVFPSIQSSNRCY